MNLFGCCDLPLWLILVVCCLLLLYKYGCYTKTAWSKLGVASPPGIAFMGHMHELYNPKTGFRACISKWTKQYGKIFGVMFFRDPMLVVSDLELLKDVFVKDFSNYTDRHIFGSSFIWQPMARKGLFFNSGEDWKRIRRIMSPSFSSGKLKLLTHYINITAKHMMDQFHTHAELGTHPEAKTIFSAYSLDALVGPAFGLELNSQKDIDGAFYQHAKQLMTIPESIKIVFSTIGMFPAFGPLFKMLNITFFPASDFDFFVNQLTKLVLDKKANPSDGESNDFLQFLINAEADSSEDLLGSKKLTTEEIVAQGIIFVIAGYETTSTTLQWLSYELAKNHEIQKKLREEINNVVDSDGDVTYEHCQELKYSEAAINETLRMYPPVIQLTRLAKESRVLKGNFLPAGASVLCPIYTIGRDPELFEDPDTFNPDRFMDNLNAKISSISFLPFGYGPRQCIGMRLALIQLKIALVHMMKALSVEDTVPRNVEIKDFSGLLVPAEPIRLVTKMCKA